MASHLSTPESVLMAPGRTFTVISAQIGFTRRERRHGFAFIPNPGMNKTIDEINRAAYDVAHAAGTNVPHVGYAGPDPEREQKRRNRRKARHARGAGQWKEIGYTDEGGVLMTAPVGTEAPRKPTPLQDALRSLDWRRRAQ